MEASSKSGIFGRIISRILGNNIAVERHFITMWANFVMQVETSQIRFN